MAKGIMEKQNKVIVFLLVILTLTACATHKKIESAQIKQIEKNKEIKQNTKNNIQYDFLKRVESNCVDTKDIVADAKIEIKSANKNISLPVQLRMRKDKVIRLQLLIPILGSEIGRIEFTPNYVMLVDRIHKEYFKADYSEMKFLKNVSPDFYTLQAMFWNTLPTDKSLPEEQRFSKMQVNLNTQENVTITTVAEPIKIQWITNKYDARINNAKAYYKTNNTYSALNWKYANFKLVGLKYFPLVQNFDISFIKGKNKQGINVNIDLEKIKTNNDWKAETEISTRYKKFQVQDVFEKILKM